MPYAAVAVVYSMICDFAFLKQSQQRTEDDCCLVVSSVNMILSFVDNIRIKKDLCKTLLQVFLTIHLPMYDKLLETFTETEKDSLKLESALIPQFSHRFRQRGGNDSSTNKTNLNGIRVYCLN